MRWFAVLAVALAAAPAALATPGNDVATGHGTINRTAPFVASFRFAAESQPDGTAHGFYTQTLSSPDGPTPFGGFTGDITCLEVLAGDTAVMGGIVTETTDPRFGPGEVFWVSARDGRRTDTPDSESFVFLSDTPAIDFGPGFPDTCDTPFWVDPFPFNPVLKGEILVNG
jgi:hypothetical protein